MELGPGSYTDPQILSSGNELLAVHTGSSEDESPASEARSIVRIHLGNDISIGPIYIETLYETNAFIESPVAVGDNIVFFESETLRYGAQCAFNCRAQASRLGLRALDDQGNVRELSGVVHGGGAINPVDAYTALTWLDIPGSSAESASAESGFGIRPYQSAIIQQNSGQIDLFVNETHLESVSIIPAEHDRSLNYNPPFELQEPHGRNNSLRFVYRTSQMAREVNSVVIGIRWLEPNTLQAYIHNLDPGNFEDWTIQLYLEE